MTCSPTPTFTRVTLMATHSARLDDRHPRRRPARSHDGDGRAHARLQRARARSGRELRGERRGRSRGRRASSTTPTPPRDLARHCDVVTLEIEQIGAGRARRRERHAPGAAEPGDSRHRAGSRRVRSAGSRTHGVPRSATYRDVHVTGRAREARSETLGALVREGVPRRLRRAQSGARHGRRRGRARAGRARRAARRSPSKRSISLAELSVLVARRPSGEVRVYPPALNFHERQILAWSVLPAPLRAALAARRRAIARGIAERVFARGHSRRRDVPAPTTGRCS